MTDTIATENERHTLRNQDGIKRDGPFWFGKMDRAEYVVSTIARIRSNLTASLTRSYKLQDWEIQQIIRAIDSLKDDEPEDERRMRVRHTPHTHLSPEDFDLLPEEHKQWATKYEAQRAREAACPGHEMVNTSSDDENRRGWHKGQCKHCGKDMSYDSGD